MRSQSFPIQLRWVVILVLGLAMVTPWRGAKAAGPIDFHPPFSLNIPEPFTITSQDMDGDGREDLCAYSQGNAAIFYGRGDGSFESPVKVQMGPNVLTEWAHPEGVDINGDGLRDLVCACGSGDFLAIRLNLGERQYGPVATYPAGDLPRAIGWGDFDHDNDVDVVVTNHYTHNLAYYSNQGDGTMAPAVFYPATGLSGTVAVADFNGDGDLDAAMSAYVSNEVRIFIGNGDGTFQVTQDYKVGTYPGSVTSADFNGDGHIDLAASNAWSASTTVLMGNGSGSFATLPQFPVGTYPHVLSAADFDGDGDQDLAFPCFGDSILSVLENDGTGRMKLPKVFASTGLDSRCVTTGDFNSDGSPDIAMTNHDSSNISVYLNTRGQSTPAVPAQLTATAASSSQIDLSWTDQSSNETGFRIERRTTGAFTLLATLGAAAGNGNRISYSDANGLTPSTTYIYRVQATGAMGHSGYSNEASATTKPPPLPAPSNLVAAAVSISQINVGWQDNSTGETGFEIERRTNSTAFAKIHTTFANVTSFLDGGLEADTLYRYRVRGLGPLGPTPYTNEATATTFPIILDAPVPLTATPSSYSQINLAWQDQSSLELGYEIERKTGSGNFQFLVLLPMNATSHQDLNLEAETGYSYRVRAVRNVLASPHSNVATATTPQKPLTSPAELTVGAVSSSELRLNWKDRSDFETGFEVERKLVGGVFAQIGTAGAKPGINAPVSYSDTAGLNANTTYVYRVRAITTGRFSGYSNEAAGTTSPQPPAAPSDLAAVASAPTTITLTWTDNSVNETGFRVERKTNAGSFVHIADGAADVSDFQDPGLAADTLYTYRIRALGTAGNSAFSSEAATPTAPTPPSNLTVLIPGPRQVRLNWVDNSATETNFKIERSSGGGGFTVIATTSPDAPTFLDAELPGSTTFTYRVRATNNGGDSGPTNSQSALTLPSPPHDLSVFAFNPAQLELTWISNNPSPPAVRIERRTNSTNFAEIGIAPVGSTSYTDSGLAANTTYFYRARSTNNSGVSAYSNEANATTLPGAPSVPSTLTAAATTARSVQLSWQDTSINETAFQIYRLGPQDSAYQLIAAKGANTGSHLDDVGLTGNTLYTYRIRAVNEGGYSSFSSTATVTTPADVPVTPNALTALATSSTRIRLTWSDNSDNETGFHIERKAPGGVFSAAHTTSPNATEYEDQGLQESTAYTYRVAALGVQANSIPSAEASATTRPRAPGNLVTTSGNRRIDLQWLDQSALDTGFRVERKTVGGTYTALTTTAAGVTSYGDTTPVPGTPYVYRVIATSAVGDSESSNESTASARNETPLAKLVIAPKLLNFGKVKLVTTKRKTIKLTNKGREAMSVTVGAVIAPFHVVSGGGTGQLAPKQSRVVTVEFTPSARGGVSAMLRITSTDPRAAQQDVKLSGSGK